MLRKHENTVSWKAGVLAIGVHVVLLVAMLVSFNWKSAHTVLNVTEVELWDKIPMSNQPVVQEEPKPKPSPPIVEEQPKPEPIVEEKPKPEEPKADIALEKKKKELAEKEKLLEDKRRKDEATKKLAQQMREEDLSEKTATEKQEKLERDLERDKALRKLKEDMLNEDGADDAKASSAANVSIIGEYTEKIKAKIRNNVNKTLCGDGSPEIRVEISVLPTGQIGGTPKITKSSGNDACDGAVERAIIASEPLPLPEDLDLKAQFKNLRLKFTPND